MKLLILWITGLCLCTSARSQGKKDSFLLRNAYETAKQLDAVYKGDTALSDAAKQLLLGSIMWYANLQERQEDSLGITLDSILKKGHYTLLDTVHGKLVTDLVSYAAFFSVEMEPSTFSAIHDDDHKLYLTTANTNYLGLVKKRISDSTLLNSLLPQDSSCQSHINFIGHRITQQSLVIDSLLKFSPANDTPSAKYSQDSVSLRNAMADTARLLKGKTDSLKSLTLLRKQEDLLANAVTGDKKAIDTLKARVIKYMSDNRPALEQFLLAISKKPPPNIKPKVLEESEKIFATTNQLNYQTIIDQTQAATATAFHLPSQSEVIDAIAIYLANRVKQETVMWFFEQLTKNINTFELLKTFFPSTVIFLQSREVYEIPNMGAQWRYALSRDFTNMPRNVLASPWLSKRWPQKDQNRYKDYLLGACDIAELLQKKYSYRDIIRTLYLTDTTTVKTSGIHFRDFINLLYAVNTELFLPDSASKYRMLKYEDYRNMNKDQLVIMLSLIDLKYGGFFTKFLQKDTLFTIKSQEQARRWLGQIEIAVSQFEQVRNDFLTASKNKPDDGTKDFYNPNNVWNALDELLHLFRSFSAAGNTIFSKELIQCGTAFQYIDQVHEVYGQIYNKNFAGAVQSSLSLIDTLFYGYSNDSDVTLKVSRDSIETFFSGRYEPVILRNMQKRLDIKMNYPITKSLYDSLGKRYQDNLHLHLHLGDSNAVRKYTDSLSRNEKAFQKAADQYNKTVKQLCKDSLASRFHFIELPHDSIAFSKHSPMAAVVFENDRHAIALVRKLSGFLNDVALARDDKQLAKVVESYALPTGSYKRKRNTWWSIDFNAFVGLYGGYEWPRNIPNTSPAAVGNRANGWVYGVTAPIGISLSKTIGRPYNKGKNQIDTSSAGYILNPDLIKLNRGKIYRRTSSTLTFSFSIVDLGAVVSYRFANQDSSLPQLKWTQFISPAFHIAYGIPGTPLVASAGAEYTPQLRNLNDKTGAQYSTYRVFAGILFDIPLFNLWERKRIVYQKYEK